MFHKSLTPRKIYLTTIDRKSLIETSYFYLFFNCLFDNNVLKNNDFA